MDTSGEDCRQALLSKISDFEDAVMVETAKRSKADCIVTKNIKDYANADITIYTPEEFIRVVKDEIESQ